MSMKKFINILVVYSVCAYAFADDPNFSGEWDCVIKDSDRGMGFVAESILKVDPDSSSYDRSGSAKFVVEASGVAILEASLVERGSYSLEKDIIRFSPLDADVVVNSSLFREEMNPKKMLRDILIAEGDPQKLVFEENTVKIYDIDGRLAETCKGKKL